MEFGRRIYWYLSLFLFVSLSCNDVKTSAATTTANHTNSTLTTAEAEENINTTSAKITTTHTSIKSLVPLSNASSSATSTSPKATTSINLASSSSSSTTVGNVTETSTLTDTTTSTSHAVTFTPSATSSSTFSSARIDTNRTATAIHAQPTATNVIIGVVVGVGGAILVGVIILVLVLRCRSHGLCVDDGNRSRDFDDKPSKDLTIKPYLPDKPIPVADFLEYVSHHQANISIYKAEFESLPPGNKVGKSISKGKDPRNQKLNRYINILPFNDTLVPLSDGDQSGYINASYVDSYRKERSFIASQAPLAESVGDFWQMIWEQDCGKIIMVTNLFESGRPKCDKYWPNVNETEMYGPVKVEAIAERTYGDYVFRTFRIEKQTSTKDKPRAVKRPKIEVYEELCETRLIYQFHFTAWPDQGVPSTSTALLKLYRHSIEEPLPDCRPGPVVIHCSAGVGRTGTMIALDICLAQANDQGTVDILRCIDKMRRQRMYMVQTVEQYIFIHHVLLEALALKRVEIPCPQFHSLFPQLGEPTLPGRQSRLQREFKVLEVLKPRFDESMFLVAQEYPEKNRLSTLLPADSYKPYIPSDDQSDIYINAVYVFGYTKTGTVEDEEEEVSQYNYIATQSPMANTVEDFWMMIKETGSSTIVMLNELAGVERYWPEDGRTLSFGPFNVTNIGEISSEDIRMTDLQVTVTKNVQAELATQTPPVEGPEYTNSVRHSARYDTETFNIRHFRLLSWPDAMPKEATLISLYGEVVRCQERNLNRPVVVHCLYGAERSGVFCGVMNVLDTIKMECEVDVFNAVKRIRRTRPEFIPDLAQYKYLYDVAMEQIKSLDKVEYSNYRRDTLLQGAKI